MTATLPSNEMEDETLVPTICSAHTHGGEPCKQPAKPGWNVCHYHGANGGRPPVHGRYSKYAERVHKNYREDFYDFLNDYNPTQELALLRTTLLMMVDSLNRQIEYFEDLQDDPEEAEKFDRKIVQSITSLVNNCSRTIDSIVRAKEAMTGKKMVVTFTNAQIPEEVRHHAKEFLKQCLSWLPTVLCETCRTRVSDELQNRQQTVIEADGL